MPSFNKLAARGLSPASTRCCPPGQGGDKSVGRWGHPGPEASLGASVPPSVMWGWQGVNHRLLAQDLQDVGLCL